MNIGIPITEDSFINGILIFAMILIVMVLGFMVYIGLFEYTYPEHNFFVIWIGLAILTPLALWLLSMCCEILFDKGFLDFQWRKNK